MTELLCGSKREHDTLGKTEVLPTPSVWGLLDWKGEPTGSPRTGRRKAILSLVGTQACQGICWWTPWQPVASKPPGGRAQ